MSFEELIQEHIKALNENTKAIHAYTKAIGFENRAADISHTKRSACRFCGITFKTMQRYIDNGFININRKNVGTREFLKESDLVTLCESQQLFDGEYGLMKKNPKSMYYEARF